ncbi:MAG: hypothetical protein B1H13_10790 [Desulfobacteraceae bacterium 4484_190.3]|nr:MAG: hypothetical protein B1H13_10790 [Desulfobacteraceae bacterium 4484_190.3]
MKKGNKFLVYGSLFIIVMFFLFTNASAKMVVKFGHVAPPFHGQSVGVDHFAKYVMEKTNGEVEVRTYPMGQLGGERSMAEQVQSGSLQLAAITSAVMSNFVPQASLIPLPFVFPDRRTAYAVLDSEIREKLFSYFPAKGFMVLGFTENEFRDLTNSKRPIRKPEDLKGLKIMKFTEVNKYVTITHHILTECFIIANLDWWNSLPARVQKIMRDAAYQVEIVNRGHTLRDMLSMSVMSKKDPKTGKVKPGPSIYAVARKQKVQIIELTPAEREAFKKAMTPVYAKYRSIIGADLFDAFMAKIKEVNKYAK